MQRHPFTSSDLVAHHLDAALDSLVQARLALSSEAEAGPETWYPPLSSLVTATEGDPEWRRHEARLKEVVARLEGLSPHLHEHLYELQRAALDLGERAGQVGFGLGLSLAVGQRRDTAVGLREDEGAGDTDGNRES